jgi:glucose-6-phosphate 1-dehydrogenase
MAENRGGGADVLVIFGITGDLATSMTFRALYRLERRGLLGGPIVGVASDEITAEQLVKHAREAILGSGEELDDAAFGRLAARGDHQLFARQDAVEETWRIVQPLLDSPPEALPYPRGSWGPAEAGSLIRGHPRWQQPWLAVND